MHNLNGITHEKNNIEIEKKDYNVKIDRYIQITCSSDFAFFIL